MIIGHLPAGYIFPIFLVRKLVKTGICSGYIVIMGVLGVIGPDIDMLYFQFVDNPRILKGIPGVLANQYV
jgi:hypothetical protein